MARRWWIRGLEWLGISVAVLLGAVIAAIVLVTQTTYGRERVRLVVVRLANQQLLGALHVGALRFGPGCALSVDSGSLRDPSDELLASIGATRATCRFSALVRGRLVITSLSIERPNVILRESAGGTWNWSRAVRPDTAPPPVRVDSMEATQPARLIVDGPVRITGGALTLAVPGMPVREVSGLSIDAPLVQTEVGGTSSTLELAGISFSLSTPSLALHRVSGTIAVVGDSARLDLPVVRFGQTRASVHGSVGWSRPGPPAIAARITADTVSFADFAWLAKEVPDAGGGSIDATVSSGGGDATGIVVHSVRLETTKSAVRGSLSLSLDSAGVPLVHQANLEIPGLHTDLLHRLAGEAVPPAMRGSLQARIVARSHDAGQLRIEAFDARYVDETAGTTSRVTGRGVLTSGRERGGPRATLELTAHSIDSRTVAQLSPSFPLTGTISGEVSVVASPDELRITRSDIRYREGDETILRLHASGSIELGPAPAFDLKIDTRSFAPAAVRGRYPALAGVPAFEGPIELRGTATDLSMAASLHGSGGNVALAGRYQDTRDGIVIRSTVRVRDADPRLLSGRASVPGGRLNADLAIDLAGDSLPALRGTAHLSSLTGTIAGIAIDSAVARFALADDRIVADSVVVSTSAGDARLLGALGMRRGVRDTMTVAANLSLAGLQPLLRELSARDTAAADTLPRSTLLDSASGTVNVRARLVGSLDSLDATGEAEGSQVVMQALRATRVQATAELRALPASPRGHATVRGDSVTAAGSRFSTFTAAASSTDGRRWHVTASTATRDVPGGEVSGAITRRGDTTVVEIDSLSVRAFGSGLRLVRPTRFLLDTSGTMVLDSVDLRGERGSRITLAGVLRDTGSIAMALQLTEAPLAVPGPATEGDSIRMLVDSRLTLGGTARVPRATLQARVRIRADSIVIDSVVAEGAYEEGRARIDATAHGVGRPLAVAHVVVPLRVSLAPFATELTDDSLTGELRADSLELRALSGLLPGISASAGWLRSHLTLSGTARRPRANGMLDLRGGAAIIEALGIQLLDANASLELSQDRMTIRNATVRGAGDPGGRAEFSGVIGLADSATTDLRVRTSTMPVMRSSDLADLDVSADLRLAGAAARPTLSGRITVDRGVIRLPDMGHAGVVGVDDTAFVRLVDSLAPQRAHRAPARTSRLVIGTVEVAMGPNVWIRSADASIQLGGSVRLEQAPPEAGLEGRPFVLRGALVTQRGNYRMNVGAITRSFELEEGSVQFTGETELNPRLDINALYAREGADEAVPRVRLNVGGRLDRPVLTLSSAGGRRLTQSELMSYLITGQTQAALGDVSQGAVTSELVASATGALAQQLAGGTFDVVNVTAGTASTTNDRGAAASALATSRLGVGKQLSDRVFLKVDAGLCAFAAGGSTDLWQTMGVSLDYRFRRGLLGSLSSAPSTNGATCANQSVSRSTARAPRQWGFDFNRIWRF